VAGVAKEPDTPIVLYCQTGLRSMLAARALTKLGYSSVVNLQGGFQKWVQAGLRS
jgi:rhodanese-related sulfurtransferase